MPYKNPEDKKAHNKRYEEAMSDERKLYRRKWHLKNKEKHLKQAEKRNRKKGHKPTKINQRTLRVKVPRIRRYAIIGDKIYFNVETGFDLLQLSAATDALRAKMGERVKER